MWKFFMLEVIQNLKVLKLKTGYIHLEPCRKTSRCSERSICTALESAKVNEAAALKLFGMLQYEPQLITNIERY